MDMADTFICANCGETFSKGRSDQEAKAEMNALWGKSELEREGVAIICDPCFQKFTEWQRANGQSREN